MGVGVEVGEGSVGITEGVGKLGNRVTVGVAVFPGDTPQAVRSNPKTTKSPIVAKRGVVRTRSELLVIFWDFQGLGLDDFANLVLLLRSIPPGAGNHLLQSIGMLLDNIIGAKCHK